MTRTSRYLLTAGAIVAVLAIALIVGVQLNERQQSAAIPSASPRRLVTSVPIIVPPSPTANPNVTPTPTPAFPFPGSAILNDDFGFIFVERTSVGVIRKEAADARLASFTGYDGFAVAVSPDGRQVAYFAPEAGGTPQTLRVFATGGNATEQTLVTLVAGQRGGGISWSSDGAAILYSIDTGCGICGGPIGATLNIYELAAGGRHGTTIDTQTNMGWYRPIAWDRAANLAAAGMLYEGGSMGSYVTVRITSDSFSVARRLDVGRGGKLGILMQSVRASTDAKFVLGVDFETSDLKWWPLADFSANKTQAGAGKRGALWRPGTHQIGYIAPDGHALNDVFWLGDVDKAGPQQLCCVALGGVPPTATLGRFRADGSAVVLVAPPTAGPGEAYDYTLVRLPREPQGGLEYPTSGDRMTFQGLGVLIASVRLR